MEIGSVLWNDDLGTARTLAILAGHQHDDDADRLATACRLRGLGQRSTILLGHLLADRVAVIPGDDDRIVLVGRRDRRGACLRREQPGSAERQGRGSKVGAKRFHGRRCNASVLNVK